MAVGLVNGISGTDWLTDVGRGVGTTFKSSGGNVGGMEPDAADMAIAVGWTGPAAAAPPAAPPPAGAIPGPVAPVFSVAMARAD